MRLRPSGPYDSLLLAGCVLSLLAFFPGVIQTALGIPGLRPAGTPLVPALLILLIALLYRWRIGRDVEQARAAACWREAESDRARDDELERLLLFGQSLAGSLSLEELRKASGHHLSRVVSHADVWGVIRNSSGCDRLLDVDGVRWAPGEIERIAALAGGLPQVARASPGGILCEDHLCFVMLAGSRSIGVVGMPAAMATPDMRRNLGAAAALLTVAVHNSQLFTEVRDNGVKDGLTGCYNRTHALQMLNNELARSRRSRSPLSLILIDVDHFKQINDRCGHLAGDSVLDTLGDHLRRVLRRNDIRCRYGGDEFLLVLPETPAAGAARVIETLRAELERSVGPSTADGEHVRVTISAGVTSTIGGEASTPELIERADRALYHAKAAGRNCVRIQASACGAVTAPPATARAGAPEEEGDEFADDSMLAAAVKRP